MPAFILYHLLSKMSSNPAFVDGKLPDGSTVKNATQKQLERFSLYEIRVENKEFAIVASRVPQNEIDGEAPQFEILAFYEVTKETEYTTPYPKLVYTLLADQLI